MKRIVEFLFEAGMLKKTPRTGYQFLGTGAESVADHSFRTAVIGYVLANGEPSSDPFKVVLMCLFHDLPEARTGDQNYVNKRYVTADEEAALKDQVEGLAFGPQIRAIIREFNACDSLESRLAKDADQLDLILELKEQLALGNPQADEWLHYAVQRLRTEGAREMARQIQASEHTSWWFQKRTDWWVNGPNNDNGVS
ncbi:MAG: HD domain-containing protein [Deltaproteobacteria bacterium]|nr:HD domain-containing protein [Deltaproteobacteria bacterium]MBW1925011.1 HD domain-containing protein [Deltaproteobacteria bacterium]MBW1950853.1 HD domain-containing protein [Deltaproteobacteria bacterium]MBW2008896.1 HD domain-containing protein [Deltaproteobacteria bacterium]MBW2102991.1 HD domain-containing protein [Deltaproteobacteria bacterium]